MLEVFPLYIIALCSMAIAVGTFINLVLLLAVRRDLRYRKEQRASIYTELHRRVRTVETFLVKLVRSRQSQNRAGLAGAEEE